MHLAAPSWPTSGHDGNKGLQKVGIESPIIHAGDENPFLYLGQGLGENVDSL